LGSKRQEIGVTSFGSEATSSISHSADKMLGWEIATFSEPIETEPFLTGKNAKTKTKQITKFALDGCFVI
jgi:hypothetical protein